MPLPSAGGTWGPGTPLCVGEPVAPRRPGAGALQGHCAVPRPLFSELPGSLWPWPLTSDVQAWTAPEGGSLVSRLRCTLAPPGCLWLACPGMRLPGMSGICPPLPVAWALSTVLLLPLQPDRGLGPGRTCEPCSLIFPAATLKKLKIQRWGVSACVLLNPTCPKHEHPAGNPVHSPYWAFGYLIPFWPQDPPLGAQ